MRLSNHSMDEILVATATLSTAAQLSPALPENDKLPVSAPMKLSQKWSFAPLPRCDFASGYDKEIDVLLL